MIRADVFEDVKLTLWPTLTVRGNRPGKQVQLQEYEIKFLCTKAREIFINQPILLELEAPIKICGKSPLLNPLCEASSDRVRCVVRNPNRSYLVLTPFILTSRCLAPQVISMDSTTICCVCSNTEDSLQRPITSS